MLRLDPRDRPEEGAERVLRVDIAGAVQGEPAIAPGFTASLSRIEEARARSR
jgi:hypothetical protein